LISKIGEKKIYKLTDFGISNNAHGRAYITLNHNCTENYSSIEQLEG